MPLLRRIVPAFALMAALAIVAAACGGDEEGGGRDRVTFMAGFKPQANLPFVGVYVAQEKGFFAEENLDVDVQHVSTPGDNFRLLATNEVQFSTADASGLLEKWAGDPPLRVVSIALIGQKGQQGFAVLENSDILTPKDWEGKTVGYKGSQVTPDYLAILEATHADRSKIREVRVGFEPQALTEGQVDVFPVFLSNEPFLLRKLGYEVRVFEAANYKAPTLGLTYVAMRSYIDENPDIVRRFLRAALRGILYAIENRDEAVEIVLKFAPEADPEHMRFMLDTEIEAASSLDALSFGIGWQTEEQWQRLHDFLVKYGALSRPIQNVAQIFDDRFLRQVYAEGPNLLD